jgi:ribosomal protein S16
MIIKYKHIIKNKSINNIIIRFQPKGCKLYTVYNIVVTHKKSRANKGKVLARLGSYNPNFNERSFFFDSIKLYHWLERGVIIHYKVKNYLMKFLIPNIHKINNK